MCSIDIILDSMIVGEGSLGAVASLPGTTDRPGHVSQRGFGRVKARGALGSISGYQALAVAKVVSVFIYGPGFTPGNNNRLGIVVVAELGIINVGVFFASNEVFMVVEVDAG